MERRHKVEGKKVRSNKSYCLISEIEKEYFPNSYNENLIKNDYKDPVSYGNYLVTEILDDIREQLTK